MSFKSNVFTLDYPKSSNRIDLYDFLRGVAMIIVIVQHSGLPGGPYFVAFHMPLFFFLSGLVTTSKELPLFGKYVWRRFKRLMIPYLCFGILSILINATICSFSKDPYDLIKAALGVITGQYGFVPNSLSGIYWFFFTMFCADLLVYPFEKYIKNNTIRMIGEAVREPKVM